MNRPTRICLIAAASFIVLASCPNPLMDAVRAKVTSDEAKSIGSFSFTMASNAKVYRDIAGTVDEAAHAISIEVPKWIPLAGLVASFEFQGASVTVNGVAQTSGTTPNDFGAPVTYTVTPTVGEPVAYTVTATSGAQGLRGGSIQGMPLDLDGTVDTVAGQASIFGDPAGSVVAGSYIYVADYAYNVIWRILNTSPYTADVFAGTVGEPGNDEAPAGPATAARFNKPWGLASDGANLYVADSENNGIRKIEIATGIVSTLASGLDGPMGLFYYPGNSLLYCAEAYSGEVSTIGLTGTVTTLLANQPTGYEWPTGIVRDASNIYVVDQGVNSIWKIDALTPTTATIFAGSNSYIGGWVNGTGNGAQFQYPSGLAFLSAGELLVADSGNNEIRSVTVPGASVNTWAGSHTQPGTRDGLVGAMLLYGPQGIFVTPTNMVIITETGNKLVRKIQSSTGSTIAGTAPGSANGVGSAARFNVPRQLTTDGSSIRIVDGFNHVIRSLDPASRTVGTLAGVVQANQPVIEEADGSSSTALFSYPSGITQVGSLVFICDNVANTIRKLDLVTMQVTTFAGTKWSAGFTDATGTLASFNGPTSITNDGSYLYVTDYYNHTIRRIEIATAEVVTIAGLHEVMGDADDPSPTLGIATDARFRFPFGITTDGTSLYIADRSNNKIRKIDIATGVVSTFAGPAMGSRTVGYVNATGNAARFYMPRGITTDGTYLYVADSSNNVIRRISISTAAVDTVAGPSAPDVKAGEIDGTGTAARFNFPNGITNDGTSLYVSDIWGNTIRRIR